MLTYILLGYLYSLIRNEFIINKTFIYLFLSFDEYLSDLRSEKPPELREKRKLNSLKKTKDQGKVCIINDKG